MNTAAGLIGFVCLMLFRSTDFPTVFHDIMINHSIYEIRANKVTKIITEG
jgi:hypothetical protein